MEAVDSFAPIPRSDLRSSTELAEDSVPRTVAVTRNRLAVSRINDWRMVTVNGPPLRVFNARKYVISWIRSDQHTALDKPTGIAPKEADVPLSA